MLIIGYLLHLLYTYTYTDLRVDTLLYLLRWTIVGDILSVKWMQCQAPVMLPYFSFVCCLYGIQINEMALIPPVFRGYTQEEATVMLPYFSFVCCCLTGSLFIMSTPVISGYTLKKIALWSGNKGDKASISFRPFLGSLSQPGKSFFGNIVEHSVAPYVGYQESF